VAAAFGASLAMLGWSDGENVTVDYRFAEGQVERLDQLAVELTRLQVDVLVASGTAAVQPAMRATNTIPVIFSNVTAPLTYVDSLSRPAGNVTGTAQQDGPELVGKRVQLLKEVAPNVARLGYLTNLSIPEAVAQVPAIEDAATRLGLQTRVQDVRAFNDIEGAFGALRSWGADALDVVSYQPLASAYERVAQLAAQSGVPSIFSARTAVDFGGLMYYGPNQSDQGRIAARYVDRILRGARPSDLPVEIATTVEFVINIRAAQALTLAISPDVAALVSDWVQ
jgi:putative ABC transport system substrate-binding protein